jgi:hypothetical protein
MRRPMTCLVPLFAVLTLLAACATSTGVSPSPETHADSNEVKVWAKIDGSYAAYGEFERAQAACGIKDGLPDVAAAPSPGRAYRACMRDQGWGLVSIE